MFRIRVLVALACVGVAGVGVAGPASALPGRGSYQVRVVNLFVPVNPSPVAPTTSIPGPSTTSSTTSTTSTPSVTTSTPATTSATSGTARSIAPIRVYDTSLPTKKTKPLLEVDFGETSKYVKTSRSVTVTAKDDLKMKVSVVGLFGKGERITLVVYGSTSDVDTGTNALGYLALGDKGGKQSVVQWPKVPSDKAELLIFPGALLGLLPEDATTFYFVTPGQGCLKSQSPSSQDLGFGGNIPTFFVLESGSTEVAAVPAGSGGCDGAPTIGPVTVDAQPGDRVALLPYGSGAEDLNLLVVPVGDS